MTNKPDVSVEVKLALDFLRQYRATLPPHIVKAGIGAAIVTLENAALLTNAAGGEPMVTPYVSQAQFDRAFPEPQPVAVQEARDWSKIEAFVDEFIDGYEMIGESEDGRDACYTPNENDRALLRDFISGLLAEEEFLSMFASTAPAVPTESISNFGLSAEQIDKLRTNSLKPEEIAGAHDVQFDRVRELVSWFVRFADGNANAKWQRGHAFELAYYIANMDVKRGINLKHIRDAAFKEGAEISSTDRRTLERLGVIKVVVQEQAAPTEPASFEAWAQREGLDATRAESMCLESEIPNTDKGMGPSTYWRHETETAWRAWANKPTEQAAPKAGQEVLNKITDLPS